MLRRARAEDRRGGNKMYVYWSYILFFAGSMVLILALIWFIKSSKNDTFGEPIEGTVVEIQERKIRTGKLVYNEFTPMVEYTSEGVTYRLNAPSSRGDTKYKLGQVIQMRYKPEKPERIFVVGDRSATLNAALLGILGVMMEVLGFLLL